MVDGSCSNKVICEREGRGRQLCGTEGGKNGGVPEGKRVEGEGWGRGRINGKGICLISEGVKRAGEVEGRGGTGGWMARQGKEEIG